MNSLPRKFRRPTSRLLTLSALSAFGFGLTPSACNSQPEFGDDGGKKCETNADCGEGNTCTPDGVCDIRCSSHDDCAEGEFCTSWNACEPQCASCGSSCDVTDDCPTGQHCSGGTCQQECTPGEEGGVCGEGVCSDDGECEGKTDIIINPMGGAGGMGGGGNQDCIDVEVEFEPQIPNVVLLIDRSGSMNAGGGFGTAVNDAINAGTYTPWDCDEPTWRYNVVRNILLNPDSGIVKPLEDRVRFGMALYSSPGDAAQACPQLLEVELGFGTQEQMLAEFNCEDYLTHTPTRESLTETAEALAAADVEGPKVIVLATDGEPDTCQCRDWNDNYGELIEGEDSDTVCDDGDDRNDVMLGGQMLNTAQAEQYRLVEEAQRIHEEYGITIEVINVSSPGNQGLADHLDDVAERGGATSGASIDGFNPGALTEAFQNIIDGVRSCAIDLDGEISAGKEDTGTVTLDGEELILDDPDGWVVNSPTQIELVGQACETIKTGDHDLDISFPCNAFVPAVK